MKPRANEQDCRHRQSFRVWMRFHFHLDFEIIAVQPGPFNGPSGIPAAAERRQAKCLNRDKTRTSSLALKGESCDCQYPQLDLHGSLAAPGRVCL